MNVATYRNGSWEYNLLDHLGSVQAVTNQAGDLEEDPEYAAFGKRIAGTADNARYTGKQEDSGTGLYYFGARYYDPEIGRLISEDSAKDGLNWYVYCENNPLKLVDPDGKHPKELEWIKIVPFLGWGYSLGEGLYHAFGGNDGQTHNWDSWSMGMLGSTAITASVIDIMITAGLTGVEVLFSGDKAVVTSQGTANSAQYAILKDAYKSQELLEQAKAGQGKLLAGAGTEVTLRDAGRLAAQYGGKAGDWAKMTTESRVLSNGTTVQIHYYINTAIQQIVEYKTKIVE